MAQPPSGHLTIRDELLPTEQDVRFFEKNGYWLSGQVIEEAELERLRTAMDDVFSGKFETGREPWAGGWKSSGHPMEIRKTDNAHWSNRALRALATNPTIGAMGARLMRTPEVRLWHDQLLYKPGQGKAAMDRAGNVGWHQDSHYWQCTVFDLITAWVALVDVDLENGCMSVVPGSHRWGLLPESDFFNTDLEEMKKKIEAVSGKSFETVPCSLKAGQVSFHHCLTVHGSGPNGTDQPRRSLVIHMQPAHAYYIPGTSGDAHMNCLLLKQMGGKSGDLFKGDYWPVL